MSADGQNWAHLETSPESKGMGARLCAEHQPQHPGISRDNSTAQRLAPCESAAAGLRHSRAPGAVPGCAQQNSRLKSWLDAGLAFFYPPVCQLCLDQRASPEEGYVCQECWNQVRFVTPPFCDRCGLPFEGEVTTVFSCSNCREMDLHFSRARSAVVVNETMLQVIHRYKYHRALWFEPFLIDLLHRQIQHLAPGPWDFIVPVPLHPVKEREREFNQAERISRGLSQKIGIPLNTGLLKRVKATRTQTLLSREGRATNMKNAFALASEKKLKGERVVLMDDVFTTGATTSACAKVLLAGGAGEVNVWTVARGL